LLKDIPARTTSAAAVGREAGALSDEPEKHGRDRVADVSHIYSSYVKIMNDPHLIHYTADSVPLINYGIHGLAHCIA
jgi:hypothetical protein